MTTHSTIKELERMTPSELRLELQGKREEAAKMRLGLTMQNEKNSAAYRVLRKEIARTCFVLGRMKSGGGKEAKEAERTDQESGKSGKKKRKSPSQAKKKSVQHSSS